MPDPEERDTLEQAKERFARERLPFPPLPERFAARLAPCGEHAFSTRALDHGPYATSVLVAEVLSERPPPHYATLGFDGHGVASWAVHYILVEQSLAMFLQLAWGTPQLDEQAARQTITAGFSFARSLQNAVGRALDQGRFPANDRLVVHVSSFDASGWGWVRGATGESTWQDDNDAVASVTTVIEKLFTEPA